MVWTKQTMLIRYLLYGYKRAKGLVGNICDPYCKLWTGKLTNQSSYTMSAIYYCSILYTMFHLEYFKMFFLFIDQIILLSTVHSVTVKLGGKPSGTECIWRKWWNSDCWYGQRPKEATQFLAATNMLSVRHLLCSVEGPVLKTSVIICFSWHLV